MRMWRKLKLWWKWDIWWKIKYTWEQRVYWRIFFWIGFGRFVKIYAPEEETPQDVMHKMNGEWFKRRQDKIPYYK